jgi:hypothetical protein
MNELKKIIRSPYLYVFLITYYGIWLVWNSIKIPAMDPDGIISYLPSIHYNPENNIVRFVIAVVVPPIACLALWWLNERAKKKRAFDSRLRYGFAIALVAGSVVLALAMGIAQGSTNPADNPPDAYGGPSSYAALDTFHEGESLGPAISYEQKDLKPYRNFVIVHGVFQDPLRTVIAFKLFGKSIGAERAFAVILLMITFVLYYGLLLVLFRGNLIKSALGLALLAILLIPNSTLPFINNLIMGVQFPFRDIATILFLMIAVLGLRYAVAERTRLLALSSGIIGFIVVAGFANSIDRAMYITVLSAVWLLLVFVMTRPRIFWQTTVPAYIVGCLVGLPVLGLALKWDFKDFLIYLFTMSRYKEYLDGIVLGRPNTATSLIYISVGGLLVVFGAWSIRILTAPEMRKVSFQEKLKLLKQAVGEVVRVHHTFILLAATAAFFLRSAIGRSDLAHFAYSIQWLYLLFVFAGLNYAFSSLRKYRTALNLSAVIIFVFVFGFYGVIVKDTNIRQNAFPIHVSDKDFVRSDYLQTADYLKQNLHGKQTFVTLTSEGSWYYLVDKPSPISYDIIWYAFTKPQREEIANGIADNNNIKYIVTNNNWTSDFDYVPNPVRFPEVYKVLYAKYHVYKGFGQQTLWIRNSYNTPPAQT